MSHTAQPPITHEDKNFSYSLQKERGCVVKVEVTLSKELTEKCLREGFKIAKKEFSIPGFRKGHVPDSVVHQRCSRQIAEEGNNCIVRTFFNTVLPHCKIYPHNQSEPRLTSLKISKENGTASYQIEYETTIDLPELNPAQLTVTEVPAASIDPEEIEKLYQKLAIQFGKKTAVTDRSIEENDLVTISYHPAESSCEEGCTEEHEHKHEATIYLNPITQDAEWLMPVLIGKQVGESVTATPPSEGESHPIHIHIQAIESCTPATDEEISAHFKGDSKENVYKALEKDLEMRNAKVALNQKRDAVYHALLQAYSFDLPRSVLENTIQAELGAQQKRREENQLTPISKEELQKISEQYQLYFTKKWQIDLLLDAFIKKEIAAPSDAEIQNAIVSSYLEDREAFSHYLNDPKQFRERIKDKLQRDDAVEMIYERAQKTATV